MYHSDGHTRPRTPKAETHLKYMGQMTLDEVAGLLAKLADESIPKPIDTTGYLCFEAPDFSDLHLSQDQYVIKHLDSVMDLMMDTVPLYFTGMTLTDTSARSKLRFRVFKGLKKQWIIFREVAPVLTKDNLMKRIVRYLGQSSRYRALPAREYNFRMALSINFMLVLTWLKPQGFSPSDPQSLKLLVDMVDDVYAYINSDANRKLCESVTLDKITSGTYDPQGPNVIESIILRVIYTVFSGLYFDSVLKTCITFTDRVKVDY